MPVSLAEIQKNTQDDIQAGVIDEFRKSSFLFERMPFDDAVTPGTNAGTLTYGYTRLVTQGTAATRDFNTEYTPQEATKQRYTVDLKVFGGRFAVDRVFTNVGGLVDEVTFQVREKVKATRALFHDLAINGDEGSDSEQFDGLDVALAGSSTEVVPDAGGTGYTDWTAINTQDEAFKALELVDDWLSLLDGMPTAILGNRKSINRFKFLARYAGYLTESEDAFGRKVSAYDGIPLIDLGEKPGSTDPIIPIETRDPDGAGPGSDVTGLTDLYAVRLAMDGFHGVTLAKSDELIRAYLDEFQPGYRQAGAVREGEVEMVAAVALRATKAAAVLRNVKVQ